MGEKPCHRCHCKFTVTEAMPALFKAVLFPSLSMRKRIQFQQMKTRIGKHTVPWGLAGVEFFFGGASSSCFAPRRFKEGALTCLRPSPNPAASDHQKNDKKKAPFVAI